MMRPYPAGIMACLATARATLNEPNKSMFTSFANCSSVISSALATAPVPALIDQNVNASKVVKDFLHGFLHTGSICDVAGNTDCIHAVCLTERGGHFVNLILRRARATMEAP